MFLDAVPEQVQADRPLRGYKGELYDGGIREPWIVDWPGVTRPGSVCNKPVIDTDFYPTILEMTGQDLQPQLKEQGTKIPASTPTNFNLPSFTADETSRLAELDAYWAQVSRAVKEGNLDLYVSTCHKDGVLVTGVERQC